MAELSKQEYLAALKKLENSSSDKVGMLGKLGVVASGAGLGTLGASSVAGIFGATSILGSSSLAGILGGVFVVSTPIGWILGTAAAGAAAAYGISKVLESGSVNNERKRKIIIELKEKLKEYSKEEKETIDADKISKVAGAFALLLENDLIDQSKVTVILSSVENGKINAEYALSIARSILEESEIAIENQNSIDHESLTVRSAFVLLFNHMIHIDDNVDDSEISSYQILMKNEFLCSPEYSLQLLQESGKIPDSELNGILDHIKTILPHNKKEVLVNSLLYLAMADQKFHKKEKEFLDMVNNKLN